jgi:hypothetical protein
VRQIDERVVRVSLEVNGQIDTYENLAITASGIKFTNALQNQCQITITNLDKSTQDYILTQTSPYNLNATPKTITLYAGRKSYGVSQIYVGNIVNAIPTRPPDISVVIKCLTGNFQNGNILSRPQPSQISLFQISKQIANDLRMSLTFQAKDQLLSNFSYTGAALKQINHLGFSSGTNIFIDDNVLVVKDYGVPLTNTLRVVNTQNGLVDIPQATEQGVRVKFFIDNITKLGGGLRLQSQQYSALNGDYVIYKLGFEVANRDTPFYWIAECARQQ